VNLLLDENLSPRLVSRITALGAFATHIAHLGRAGASDADLWEYAFRTDAVVATINAGDFLILARGVELHPGLIVLRRSGLSADGQWRFLEPAIRFGLSEEAAGRSLVNRVVEVTGPGSLQIHDMPPV
jgi:predicted nuclease of predicted toxin-antitoxin system